MSQPVASGPKSVGEQGGTATSPALVSSDGSAVVLDEQLGRGGEATVHALRGDSTRAVKLYTRADSERARKLAAMLAKVPRDPDRRPGHVSIAWPQSLVFDQEGAVRGFIMPRVDQRRYLALHQLYHPRSRRKRAPGISWRYLLRIARNLSATLASLHEAGYVVGDLNESNILVDDRALVTLVDLDSIQVTTPLRVFRCTVGKAEYTPPELQGRSFRHTTRRASSDRFALAVLTFMLLMEGNHPFSGVYGGEGEPPGMEENIRARRSPYFGRNHLRPAPAAPPTLLLGNSLAGLLRQTLCGPAWRRPPARALQAELERLEEDLTVCARVVTHAYPASLPACPWCERALLLGSDSFPTNGTLRTSTVTANRSGKPAAARTKTTPRANRSPPATSTNAPAGSPGSSRTWKGRRQQTGKPHPVSTTQSSTRPARAQPAGFRGSWPAFHARLPMLTILILVLLASPALLFASHLRAFLVTNGASPPITTGALLAAGLVPPSLAALALYLRARRSRVLAMFLLLAERVLRAALAASALALLGSFLAGLLLDRGSVVAGDWLLLPSLWVVAFLILLRLVGPGRT